MLPLTLSSSEATYMALEAIGANLAMQLGLDDAKESLKTSLRRFNREVSASRRFELRFALYTCGAKLGRGADAFLVSWRMRRSPPTLM